MEYEINKGIGKPVEFKGLKAQYLLIFVLGLLGLFILFIVLYMIGINETFCMVYWLLQLQLWFSKRSG